MKAGRVPSGAHHNLEGDMIQKDPRMHPRAAVAVADDIESHSQERIRAASDALFHEIHVREKLDMPVPRYMRLALDILEAGLK